jgi:chorismate mutase
VRAWVAGLLERPALWVATTGPGAVVGFLHLGGDWLDQLFVHPDHQGRGVGTALVELATALRPRGFGLRVHQANTRARAFYARCGLIELEHTDGSSYSDGSPDVQMAWLGEDPLAYLRRRIDEVDAEVAVLLARRVALTAAVQERKEVGGLAGRDLRREQEIVERMARRVPELGADRIARVMHTVIEESLAAWEQRPEDGPEDRPDEPT